MSPQPLIRTRRRSSASVLLSDDIHCPLVCSRRRWYPLVCTARSDKSVTGHTTARSRKGRFFQRAGRDREVDLTSSSAATTRLTLLEAQGQARRVRRSSAARPRRRAHRRDPDRVGGRVGRPARRMRRRPAVVASTHWRRCTNGPSPPATTSWWQLGSPPTPNPPHPRKRDYFRRRSFNLVSAFATHRSSVLRYMYDLDVAFTNNQRGARSSADEAAPQDLRVLPKPHGAHLRS